LLGEIITFLYITAVLLSIIPYYRRGRGSLLKANARDGLLNEISARGRDVPSALLLFSGNDNERDFTLRGALPDTVLLSYVQFVRSLILWRYLTLKNTREWKLIRDRRTSNQLRTNAVNLFQHVSMEKINFFSACRVGHSLRENAK